MKEINIYCNIFAGTRFVANAPSNFVGFTADAVNAGMFEQCSADRRTDQQLLRRGNFAREGGDNALLRTLVPNVFITKFSYSLD